MVSIANFGIRMQPSDSAGDTVSHLVAAKSLVTLGLLPPTIGIRFALSRDRQS
jgi:hypothetical protein